MNKFKINSENRRMKNLIDNMLIDTMKVVDENEVFSKKEIKQLISIFNKLCENLHHIDNNITKVKLEATGEIIINQISKEMNIDLNHFSSNKIRQFILEIMTNLIDKSDDLYTDVVQAICSIGGICNIYINNIKPDISGTDFTEI